MSFGLGSKDLWKEDSLAHGTSVGKLCSLSLSLALLSAEIRVFRLFLPSVCVCVRERAYTKYCAAAQKGCACFAEKEREQLQSLQKARAIYDEIMLLWGAVESTVHLCKVERN
jgi:hypothetical protein